jgi:alkanesulfonate monooxygenase SsuD/methylene tetrahydromethanopterin reductase-like flavin-dependent oxidoreductase (luciferase family)
VARNADVWHTYGDAATLRRKGAFLDRLAQEAGRDPRSIRRSTDLSISEPWDEVLARAESVAALGIDHLTVSWPGQGRAHVEEFVTRVVPQIREMA